MFNKYELFRHEELSKSSGKDVYVARCRPCGLTAMGDTEDKAVDKLLEMIRYDLRLHISQNT